jgi:cell division protein FtsI/penicillin-binding protein 2
MDSDGLYAGRSPRAWAAVGALALVILIFLVLIVLAVTGPKAQDALERFAAAISRGDADAAAAVTTSDPESVQTTLEENVDGLDGATLQASVVSVDETGSEATGVLRMRWEVPEIGLFEYENGSIRLQKTDGDWLVDFSSRTIHPALREDGERLGTSETLLERAPILGRSGEELVSVGPVVDVGIRPEDAGDIDALVASLQSAVSIDPTVLADAIESAEPDSLVPVITLREEELQSVEAELRALDGVELAGRKVPLTPTRDFARAVLGTVGPATAEQVEASEGKIDADDVVGQFGLQAAFDEQLTGTPERSIVVRNAEGDAVETLKAIDGKPGEPLETTIDLEIQVAAEEALEEASGKAALVAIEPGTGDILATANRPTDDSFNRAFAGQYPPGSTFKVITTEALLMAGLDPDETVDCPASVKVGGREFVNFEGSAAGAVPFSTDFAQSCNTAFVSLSDQLESSALRDAGRLFGIGRDLALPLDAFGGRVPRTTEEVEQAAAMIGQGKVLVSPLAMAGVAATAQTGTWRGPRLVADSESEAGEPLPAEDAETRTLMRSVVTSGTGTALAGVAGEPIGKSGTAEFGSADPPKTRAWFIAAREDIAVAVLVERGESGGAVAAPIAASFLTAIGESDSVAVE